MKKEDKSKITWDAIHCGDFTVRSMVVDSHAKYGFPQPQAVEKCTYAESAGLQLTSVP